MDHRGLGKRPCRETLGGAVYVEPPDSERFVRVYDRLLNSALGPAESAELIRAIGEDLS